MAIERLGDRLLEIGARHRLLREALEQYLALVDEAGGTVTALEREVLDEGLLQNGSSPFLACPSIVRIDLPSKLAAGTTQVGVV